MNLRLGFSVVELLLLGAISASISAAPAPANLSSFDRKLERLEDNGRRAHPDGSPTVFTEQEINAYLASSQVALPEGVESLRLEGHPQKVTGNARVNFDRVRAGIGSANPLLALFSGIHDVVVASHAYAVRGQGHVHVDSVSLDGVEIPQFLLQMFVEKYVSPQYPEIGVDSVFSLPDRIDSASLGEHTLTILQK